MNNTVKCLAVILGICVPFCSTAQVQTAAVGVKVKQTEIRNSSNEPIKIPYFGEKHLLIFYTDPLHGYQNREFTDYLEDNHIISDNIYAFGIVNLKDAPLFPNSLLRSIIRKKEKKNNAKIHTDPDHLLIKAWGLGSCSGLFTFIFVTRDGEIAYLKKGKLSQKDIDEFWEVIEKYK